MLQFIPGTDFITSGYGAIPRPDNMFGGGNFDVSELDDWYVLQRDMRVDGGIDAGHRGARARSAGARGKGVADGLRGRSASRRSPTTRSRPRRAPTVRKTCPTAIASPTSRRRSGLQNGPLTVLDVIAALDAGGYREVAANVLEMQRQRVIGAYLQPSAIFDRRFPGAERAHRPERLPAAREPATGWKANAGRHCRICRRRGSRAPGWNRSARERRGGLARGGRPGVAAESGMEVVIAVGPAFGGALDPDDRRPRPSRRAAGDRRRTAATRASRRGSCASGTPRIARSSATRERN